ncbi:hypothetical protein ACF8CX_03655, partial [Vibrio mimicus]
LELSMDEQNLFKAIDEFVDGNPQVNIEKILCKKLAEIRKSKSVEISKKHKLFNNESELKQWFKEHLEADFRIRTEVEGVYGDSKVKIDFMLVPRKHLIEEGFVKEPIGVEVKYFDVTNKFTKKSSRAIWQTVSYKHSVFKAETGEQYTPAYCVLFSNLSFKHERELLLKYVPTDAENDEMEWRGMLHLANHAGVGTFEISGSRKYYNGWAIKSVGGVYFRAYFCNGSKAYHLSNPKLISKERHGNF